MDIVIDHITKKYGNQIAVNNLSFKVSSGEIVGFLGPNGAGKTTTMKIITGLVIPNKGDVFIDGISVSENNYHIKKNIGYLPEHNPLYLDMDVISYLEFMANVQGVAKSKISERVILMVKLTGLNREKHKRIGELSKGFRQRVGIAQALIHDPEILILDEPTTGLDPNQRIEIRELIKEIGKTKTVLLSSHILAEIEATCHRIIIIDKGIIVANETPEQLRKQSSHNSIIRVKIEGSPDDQIIDAIRQLKAVVFVKQSETVNCMDVCASNDTEFKKELFEICSVNKWYISEITTVENNLEDIFRNLTSI